jgi:hypothetical protein
MGLISSVLLLRNKWDTRNLLFINKDTFRQKCRITQTLRPTAATTLLDEISARRFNSEITEPLGLISTEQQTEMKHGHIVPD